MAIVFLDTEFTDLLKPEILSIGLVGLDGGELYVELDLNSVEGKFRQKRASEFVKYSGVLNQWGLIPGAACTEMEMGRRAAEWLLEFAARSGSKIEVAFDYSADYELLASLLKCTGFWHAVEQVAHALNISCMVGSLEAELTAEARFDEVFLTRGLGRHHALADAYALRAVYKLS